MKISQLVEFNIDEERAGGALSTRAASTELGQNIGRSMKYMTPDQKEKAIAAARASAANKAATDTPAGAAGSFKNLPGSGATPKPQAAGNPVNLGTATPDPVVSAVPGQDQAPDPAAAQTTNAVSNPQADTQPDANKPKEPGALKKAWDYANSEKSGKDISKFGAGVADAAGALNRGAQGFVKGASDLGSTVAQGLGNVGSALAGGATQALGAAAGGLGRGYHTARSGNSFANMVGQKNSNDQPYQGDQYQGDPYRANAQQSNSTQGSGIAGAIRSATGVGGGQQSQQSQQSNAPAGPSPEVADLKRRVGAINQRLDKIQQTVKQISKSKTSTTPQLTNNPSLALPNNPVNQTTVPVAEGLLRPHVRRRAF